MHHNVSEVFVDGAHFFSLASNSAANAFVFASAPRGRSVVDVTTSF